MNKTSQAMAPANRGEARHVDLVLASIVTYLPPAAFVLGLWLWYLGVLVPGAVEWVTLVVMQALTILGIELGYHRLLSHGSYRAHRAVKMGLIGLGSMAFQGPVIWWVSIHRKHHRFPDKPGDPHSMYVHGERGEWTARGAVHAHLGWLRSPGSIGKGGFADLAGDLYKDRDLFWMHMHYMGFLVATFAIPTIIGAVAHGTLKGALGGLLWGGFIRIFFSNHLTFWCINSVLHGVGRRPYATSDKSTNFALLSLFTWGQGWHNNHHAYPAAAVMGHKPWELDPGAWVLFFLRKLGLVDRIIIAPANLKERALRGQGEQEKAGSSAHLTQAGHPHE